jgi:hypothetical protein
MRRTRGVNRGKRVEGRMRLKCRNIGSTYITEKYRREDQKSKKQPREKQNKQKKPANKLTQTDHLSKTQRKTQG